MRDSDGFYLVAVHGGAGFHAKSGSSDASIKRALKNACQQSVDTLRKGAAAIDVVEKAISVLEDDPSLNAGYGSNLTLDGTVECDAALMDGSTQDFGSVAAVSGIKNPIKLARAVLQNSRAPDIVGRIPPITLVSRGAEIFAEHHDLQRLDPNELVAPKARQEWETWTSRRNAALDAAQRAIWDPRQSRSHAAFEFKDMHNMQDTVGAVAWDFAGGLAAGVSSGGLLLKQPGRVGEAGVFGAGCWAQSSTSSIEGVACSVSGAGEYIIRSMLAKTAGDVSTSTRNGDTHDALQHIFSKAFYEVCKIHGEDDANAGILLLIKERGDNEKIIPRLWCAFTTHSMAIAYASSMDPKPKALILRRDSNSQGERAANLPVYITMLPLTRT